MAWSKTSNAICVWPEIHAAAWLPAIVPHNEARRSILKLTPIHFHRNSRKKRREQVPISDSCPTILCSWWSTVMNDGGRRTTRRINESKWRDVEGPTTVGALIMEVWSKRPKFAGLHFPFYCLSHWLNQWIYRSAVALVMNERKRSNPSVFRANNNGPNYGGIQTMWLASCMHQQLSWRLITDKRRLQYIEAYPVIKSPIIALWPYTLLWSTPHRPYTGPLTWSQRLACDLHRRVGAVYRPCVRNLSTSTEPVRECTQYSTLGMIQDLQASARHFTSR